MAHSPETPTRYICVNCQVTHAGTPVKRGPGDYSFEPPDACGACGESTFAENGEWARHAES